MCVTFHIRTETLYLNRDAHVNLGKVAFPLSTTEEILEKNSNDIIKRKLKMFRISKIKDDVFHIVSIS